MSTHNFVQTPGHMFYYNLYYIGTRKILLKIISFVAEKQFFHKQFIIMLFLSFLKIFNTGSCMRPFCAQRFAFLYIIPNCFILKPHARKTHDTRNVLTPRYARVSNVYYIQYVVSFGREYIKHIKQYRYCGVIAPRNYL